MEYSSLRLEFHDGLASLTLTQAERGNPFDAVFCAELPAALDACASRSDLRAVLISAEGKYFSVGGDLKTLSSDRVALPSFVARAVEGMNASILTLSRLEVPTIACVHGMTAGGAVGLAAACDFVVAGASARFHAAFAGIGIVCDSGLSYHLPRRVGLRRASEFILLNETWDAQLASEFGLVNNLAPDANVFAEALNLATRMAAGPTRAFSEIKRLLSSSLSASLEQQLANEALAMNGVASTEDAWNAIVAKATKKTPHFQGK